jgi:hypothetical protein
MAVLSNADRLELWAEFMRRNKETWGAVTKDDLKTVVDSLDAWADANKADALASIPQPTRGRMTAGQVALCFALIVEKRWTAGA